MVTTCTVATRPSTWQTPIQDSGPGQPFHLDILKALADIAEDPDVFLWTTWSASGVDAPVLRSGPQKRNWGKLHRNWSPWFRLPPRTTQAQRSLLTRSRAPSKKSGTWAWYSAKSANVDRKPLCGGHGRDPGGRQGPHNLRRHQHWSE